MRRIFSLLLIISIIFCLGTSQATECTVTTWEELCNLASSGADRVFLGADIQCGKVALTCSGSFTIVGCGFSLSDISIDGGRVIFENVNIQGINGKESDSGLPAMTVLGDGTVIVLNGSTMVSGGRSGVSGVSGGSGIVVEGSNCGLLLRGNVSVSGGIGRGVGGDGISVTGPNASILATDQATVLGGAANQEGGSGVSTAFCSEIQISGQAMIGGGDGYVQGGNAIKISPADTGTSSVNLAGSSVLSGGNGMNGGNAITAENTDVVLNDTCILFGGSGSENGSTIHLIDSSINYQSNMVMLYGGGYTISNKMMLDLINCEEKGDVSSVLSMPGTRLDSMPSENIPEIVENALRIKSGADILTEVENTITACPLITSPSNKLTVEKGKVTQANVGGTGLKIRLSNITNEGAFSFTQRYWQNNDSLYYILIADHSEEGFTVSCSVGALKKLASLGVTHFVYTSIAPVYCEQIFDLSAVLEDTEEFEDSIDRILFGTADKCIIYVDKNGTWNYREELTEEAQCELPEFCQ